MGHRNRNPDDETAVSLVLAGEREMYVPLLRRHYASTLGLCRRILGSETGAQDLAQDVAQEAALQAFLNLESLREPGRFGAWLHSIAANLARSALRRRRVLLLDPPVEEAFLGMSLVDTSPTPEEVRLARELHDEVLGALAGIPEINREAVAGFYLEGYSYAELAELLNVPVSTVKGRLYKGRRQLETPLTPVAREVLGTDGKESAMEPREMVEVTVADVVKVGLKDERWTSRLQAAGSMNELYERWTELPRAEEPMDECHRLLEPYFAHEGSPAVVVLKEADGERVLPIWIGFEAGLSIWLSVSGRQAPRPMTHDLMRQLMETVGLRVESVAVSRLAESTFYGEVLLSQGEQTYHVDARPSDAIALAVRLDAPIRVARPVLEEAGYESRQAWLEQNGKQLGLDENS